MVRRVHQEFLCDTRGDEPDPEILRMRGSIPKGVRDWKEPRDLFDWPGPFIRSASLSEWETLVSDPEDLARILSRLSGLDGLFLLDDRPKSDNPNAKPFASRHLRAFLSHCRQAGIPCVWAETEEGNG